MTVDADISQAVVFLIGKGQSATLARSWESVPSMTAGLRADLEEIMSDYRNLSQIDWLSVNNDLVRGMEVFKEKFARLHPELDTAALDALERKFSWDWR